MARRLPIRAHRPYGTAIGTGQAQAGTDHPGQEAREEARFAAVLSSVGALLSH